MKKLLLAAATTAFLGLVAAPTYAAVDPTIADQGDSSCTASPCTDADLDVRVTIVGGCSSIEVGDIDFGIHPVKSEDLLGQTTLEVTCNSGQAYTVELDYGVNAANATSTQRQVANEDNGVFIDYSLFSDAGRTIEWGSEALDVGSSVASTGTGAIQSFDVFGTLRQLDTKGPGVYTDLVTATLNY